MKKSISLNLHKIIAMLLIINSHSDKLFPGSIRFCLSDLSLEKYVVQFLIIRVVSSFIISFPINYLTTVVLIIVTAELLHMVDTRIVNCIGPASRFSTK